MNNLKVGFARVNINPPMGIAIRGYFKPRFAEAILDDLELNALAIECGGVKSLLISIDHCGLAQNISNKYRKSASEASVQQEQNKKRDVKI